MTTFMTPSGHKVPDIYSLDDGETTFREAVHQVNETAKKADAKNRPQSNFQNMRKSETGKSEKHYVSETKPVIASIQPRKTESPVEKKQDITQLKTNAIADFEQLPKEDVILEALATVETIDCEQNIREEVEFQHVEFDLTTKGRQKLGDVLTDEEDVLSDLELVENQEHNRDAPAGFYTVAHYTKNITEKDDRLEQGEPEVVIFAHKLQIATSQPITAIFKPNESVANDEPQNPTTNFNLQSVQPGSSRQNMHEGTERHVVAEVSNKGQPEIKLSAEEQKAVDAFVHLKTAPSKEESDSIIHVVRSNQEASPVEMRRLLVVPMQLIENAQSKPSHTNLDLDTHQLDLSSTHIIKADKGNQEAMNFSQFSGSSADMKGMVETSKVLTHNLVSTNPAAEFIETLKQNFKQFGRIKTSKLTVQMRYSGKNLTIHFNTDADQVMNVTFRTADKEWRQMLQDNAKKIEGAFENSNHTVNIKYLGE
ncbi:MAG TPA: hypothetical protein DIC42_03500 [Holosporales bacterium]|nr:hypothetical protein [Holosporales bacterium]